MKKERRFLVFGLALVLAGLPLSGGQSITMKKDIVVMADESQENIFTFGGNILVEGKVKQNVLALGGTITISGEVGDSVVGIGSRVLIKSTAVIEQDLVCLGGVLEKESGCTIGGDTVYFESSEISGKIFEGGVFQTLVAFPLIPIILIAKLIALFLWLFLAILGASLFPKPITFASEKVRQSFWPMFGTGLLVLIVFTGLVIFFALLSIVLIGIPFLLALIGAALMIKLFGRLVIFHFLGDSLSRAFGSRKPSVLGAVLLGLLLVSLIGFIPIVGALFTFFLNIIGWGVVVRTKFGTTENWFRRQSKSAPASPGQ